MSWKRVHLHEVAPSPWRNGGGVTRELLAWPDARDWRWRLSVAEVAQSGPFSRFEGVQRWFAVLHGAGVRLSVGGQSHADTVTARMRRVAGEISCVLSAPQTIAVYAIDGEVELRVDFEPVGMRIAAHTLAWRQLPAEAGYRSAVPTLYGWR